MSNGIAPWSQRHTRLKELLYSTEVTKARQEAISAALLIPQYDDNAASAAYSHHVSAQKIRIACQEEELGNLVDASLTVLWSAPVSSKDTNIPRCLAQVSLKTITHTALSESSRDLSSITCLESNREGTVELVRCRMDRKIYVLKSTTKGAAKRGYKSNAPVTERLLLSLAKEASLGQGRNVFTPACIASFQSQGSLHILMEYCPAGDLYHFLESAGQAPISNEARNKSGGLLSEKYVRSYAIDMVAAITWLHEQGFMHRDIKPGNWLFDKSGHLLLCDLASAAPFSSFDRIPPSGNLPDKDLQHVSKGNQRRVLYRHCCLIGTADYIAPEIFWSADLISRRKERLLRREDSRSVSEDESLISSVEGGDDEEEPPADGPGLYGPECDWWSLGVVLFEMVYKRMPFFSEKIAETMEMIKNHERYFQIDSWVQCSPLLKDLIQGLITTSEKRLGYKSSTEVQNHAFFRRVDWTQPWQSETVPFVPRLEPDLHQLESPGGLSVLQEEPSVLHSPRFKQDLHDDSTHLSRMWSGDPDDFPAFPNSAELSRGIADDHIEAVEDEDSESDSGSSNGTITTSSPSTRKAMDQVRRSSAVVEAEKMWSRYDPTWIGFSYVPDKYSFRPDEEAFAGQELNAPSPISSPDNSGHSNYLLSPQSMPTHDCLPMISTPCQSRDTSVAEMPSYHPIAATPYHPSAAHNLHRRAMETASRARSESIDRDPRQSFATPIRKTSTPVLSSQADRLQMMSNLQTPANVLSSPGNAVPASPYPFPIATAARPKKTPAAARIPSSGLRRADLQRARSASVEVGEGSDSRCSGGSNVKRDISEREAWKELKVAVMQSARKGRRDFVKELEDRKEKVRRANEAKVAKAVVKRPPLQHAATDSHIVSVSNDPNKEVTSASDTQQVKRRGSTFGLGALGGALKGKRPNMPRFLSHNDSKAAKDAKQEPLKPVISMTSPEKPASIISSSSASSSPMDKSHGNTSTRHRLAIPNLWGRQSNGEAGKLTKKKSARQLLLKAQDRETPTKIASRSVSPLLSSFRNVSLSEQAGDASKEVSRSTSISKIQAENKENVSPTITRNKSKANLKNGKESTLLLDQRRTQSSDEMEHIRLRDRSSSLDVRLSSPPQSAKIAQLIKEESVSYNKMRRRDSREMLSQYRQGINPDETMEELETIFSNASTISGSTQSLALRRGPKRVMSIQVLRPASAANRSLVNGLPGEAASLSSPSLPSFPDAFSASIDAVASRKPITRRTSMVPMVPMRTSFEKGGSNKAIASAATATKANANATSTVPPSKSMSRPGMERFHSLQDRRSLRAHHVDISKMSMKEGRAPNPRVKTQTLISPMLKKYAEDENVGELSVLGGLDWRYQSMQQNLSQVEQRLERIKARLRDD